MCGEACHATTLDGVVDAFEQWWDGVELWLAQLAFPFQFALLMCVLLPLSLGLAAGFGSWITRLRFGSGCM